MTETTIRRLNPTESIINALPILIEAFVTFYGESEREEITKKFSNMLVVGFSLPKNIQTIINESDKEKSQEIVTKFLKKLTDNPEEQEKLNKFFLDKNELTYQAIHPINKYIEYLNGNNISSYNKSQVVAFLQQFHPETTIENLDELIKKATFKSVDTIILLYKQMIDEYRKYELEIKPYVEYVDNCNELQSNLQKKYIKEFIQELKYLFTEEEFKEVEKNSQYFIFLQNTNNKTKNYIASSWNGQPLIESFSHENEEMLLNGTQWKKNSIKKDRIQYFKNFGLDLGDDYEQYLNNPKAKELMPSQELIERIKNAHKQNYTKMMNEYYTSLPEYQHNRNRINAEGLMDKDDGYDSNAYENQGTAICTNVKLINGEYINYPIFRFCVGSCTEYLDHTIIHELNHAYELTLKRVNNNTYEEICGWDELTGILGSQENIQVSLEKRTEKRNYELFNEIINELISQEISTILSQSGQYIFNTKEDKKIKGGTSYELTKYLVYEFYQTYKKEIIESRKNGNIQVLLDAVGKENFEELNKLFQEHNEHLSGMMTMAKVYEDIEKGIETEKTQKFKELISKRNEILTKMEEYNKQRTL